MLSMQCEQYNVVCVIMYGKTKEKKNLMNYSQDYSLKNNMQCAKCSKPVVHRWSPDLDLNWIGACEEHKELVEMAYIALCTSGYRMYKQVLWKKLLK